MSSSTVCNASGQCFKFCSIIALLSGEVKSAEWLDDAFLMSELLNCDALSLTLSSVLLETCFSSTYVECINGVLAKLGETSPRDKDAFELHSLSIKNKLGICSFRLYAFVKQCLSEWAKVEVPGFESELHFDVHKSFWESRNSGKKKNCTKLFLI